MARVALISVSDKSGLAELGEGLRAAGWRMISTGGTARALADAGCEVTQVSDYTGFPEILDGRVKTLHPKVFAGILANSSKAHQQAIAELGIDAVDLVVVNLYPFAATVGRPSVTLDEAVEQIDIGGPSLLRAAAKNHERVTVVVDPADYRSVLDELASGATSLATRQGLAVKAYRHTACYDATIAAELPALINEGRRSESAAVAAALLGAEELPLRYGENPHQWGLLARGMPARGLAGARQLQGKELSYNNFGDASGAWRLVWDLPGPGVAIIKHANPCGVGLAESMEDAFLQARATDPVSAFGGVIVANREIDAACAARIVENFAEVVVAPAVSEEARAVLAGKKNLRVLEAEPPAGSDAVVKTIDGGFVVQAADAGWQGEGREVVTERAPSAAEMSAMELAWRVVKHVGSNAIVVGREGQIVGIGAGQMSRVDAAKIAVAKAVELGHDVAGTVAASDAFFPFPDGVEALFDAGVRAVIQPGGSIRDADVIAACNRIGMAMVMTGRRHFRH